MEQPLYIYGKHPVQEVLLRAPKTVQKIFTKDRIDPELFASLKDAAAKYKIPMTIADERKLATLADGGVHQGVIALIAPVAFLELKEWIKILKMDTNPSCIVLDELEDPHNVGAIIRTAAGLGASGVILGKHNQSQITGAVYKASAGTIAAIPIIRVANINDALLKLKDAGFWIAGLAASATETLWEGEFNSPTCFVIGAEGKGVRQKTREHCDFLFSIPMAHTIESLNASVSAALALYEWRRSKE
ncbi:MAG: 23S rRNA (guanosine(2251)-2'-O)-methyltransferase RlmB [Candidatus Pacebacteria bacterium]|jgi:23S rRNA (guanosine2251-2'-O)-methyltransferase|nr:23S rRNA (guanosine(2251)-2'-O)-methyltransferase RlmB [Candidatus Paceibacterota bacterium]